MYEPIVAGWWKAMAMLGRVNWRRMRYGTGGAYVRRMPGPTRIIGN